MADKINVKIKAKAYERSHPKTNLSDFDNDLGFVDKDSLEEQLKRMRQWIIDHFADSSTGNALAGGNLYGGDICDRDTAELRKIVSGEDIQIRASSSIQIYVYGGKLTQETKNLWDC